MNKFKHNVYYLINKYIIESFFEKLPWIGLSIKRYKKLNRIAKACGYEPGHYYSPIPSLPEIKNDANRIYSDYELLDIDLNKNQQFAMLETFKKFFQDLPYDFINGVENQNLRYRWVNGCQYRFSDVVFLYCFIRYLRPNKIVEVGSGASSSVMLDINELFFDSKIETTFIEPYPKRLLGFLKDLDKKSSNIISEKVQDVEIDIFLELNENDILFIDSSHVIKTGSDVNYLFFKILPRLRSGVYIHFHDIFFPFELPEHWVLKHKRFWNENYLLRAFLMNNNSYEILLFNSYLHKEYKTWFEKEMPACLLDEQNTGSIWLRKK